MDTSADKFSKPSCKNLVSDEDRNIHGEKYKKCQSCRAKDNANTAAQRKRKHEEPVEPVPQAAPAAPQYRSGSGLDGSGPDMSGPAIRQERIGLMICRLKSHRLIKNYLHNIFVLAMQGQEKWYAQVHNSQHHINATPQVLAHCNQV